jgi:hypothetical protein
LVDNVSHVKLALNYIISTLLGKDCAQVQGSSPSSPASRSETSISIANVADSCDERSATSLTLSRQLLLQNPWAKVAWCAKSKVLKVLATLCADFGDMVAGALNLLLKNLCLLLSCAAATQGRHVLRRMSSTNTSYTFSSRAGVATRVLMLDISGIQNPQMPLI